MSLIAWNIYEISNGQNPIHNVMLRGRVRKFAIEESVNCIVENAADAENVVRFAIPDKEDAEKIKGYIQEILPGASIKLILESTHNPVVSKLKVNDATRYQ